MLILRIEANQSLDSLGLEYGTDKSSISHAYTKIYEKYFSPLKEKPLRFLEIGFFQGNSAHMWEKYFSDAQLFFIDIDPLTRNFFQNFARAKLSIVNQENPNELSNFIREVGGDFDIIIDDGGHTMNQQIISFKVLFPFLKSGGIYVIEDLHTSYTYIPDYERFHYNNTQGQTAVEFLQSLIHSINNVGARNGCADFSKCPESLYSLLSKHEKEIESLHFYCSLCFIFKR